MTTTEWPIVTRDKVVRAYKPLGPTSGEALFRTLRRNRCVTAGRSIRVREGGRLRGQVRIYSSLNVLAARWARHEWTEFAEEAAIRAGELEAGEAFQELCHQLDGLPAREIAAVAAGRLSGVVDPGVLRAAATATQQVETALTRPTRLEEALADVIEGHVAAVNSTAVGVAFPGSVDIVFVPRWMAVEAHRDRVGDPVIIRTERLAEGQAVVEVVPAIDLDDQPYSPFGRATPANTRITADDFAHLSTPTAPARVVVPVVIST
ncbi:MAG: hypothetical protein HOY78_36585 [Saccharothrix sp.]|jgi:hypothetical protein|nr:hypothetical protein [Saccharothrix sp.]